MSGEPTTTAVPDLGAAGSGRLRNPGVAAILAVLFGTVGQVYCGRLRRAIAWALLGVVLLVVVAFLLMYFPNGRIGWIASAVLILGYWGGIVFDAVWLARRRLPADRWYQRWWCYVIYGLLAGAFSNGVATVARSQFAEAFYLPAGSMENSLLAGDRVLVDKLRYRFKPVAPGDVVVFWSDNRHAFVNTQSDYPGRRLLVSRVIGVPGDKIQIHNEKVYRNGEPIEEPYVLWTTPPQVEVLMPTLRDTPEIVLGDNEYFVLSDKRRESLDSRIFGPVVRDDIVGKVATVFWSREAPPPDPQMFPPGKAPPSPPPPPRRIRWERFGQRVE